MCLEQRATYRYEFEFGWLQTAKGFMDEGMQHRQVLGEERKREGGGRGHSGGFIFVSVHFVLLFIGHSFLIELQNFPSQPVNPHQMWIEFSWVLLSDSLKQAAGNPKPVIDKKNFTST